MKAQFSLTAVITVGLALQGCSHEGPNPTDPAGPQLAKQTAPGNPGASATPSSSASTAGSMSGAGSATNASTAPASPIGSTSTETTASAATVTSAKSNPARNRQHYPVRGRVHELDELTAKDPKMTADSPATEGIRDAMSNANEADTHALDADNRANQAQQTAQTRITSVEQIVSKLDQYEPVTQTEIRFRPGQSALSQNAKDALDQLATSLKAQKGYIVEVQGFSPGNGTAAVENSRSMEELVVRYLVLNRNVPLYRIYKVGIGNAPLQAEGGKMKRARGGRVAISLLRNGLDDLGSGAAASTSGKGEEVGGASSSPPASAQTEESAKPSQPSNSGAKGGESSPSPKPPQR